MASVWLDQSSGFHSRLLSLAAATRLEKLTGTGSDCLRQVLVVTRGTDGEEEPGSPDLSLALSDLTDAGQMFGCCSPGICRFLDRQAG